MGRSVLLGCAQAHAGLWCVRGGWGRGTRRVRGTFHVHLPFRSVVVDTHSPQNILPYFPVLKEVYLGVQLTLFPPPTRVVETDG